MEQKFIEIFTGLKRDYGYADINSAFKDPATGKLKLKYGWAAKPLSEADYLDHLSGKNLLEFNLATMKVLLSLEQ